MGIQFLMVFSEDLDQSPWFDTLNALFLSNREAHENIQTWCYNMTEVKQLCERGSWAEKEDTHPDGMRMVSRIKGHLNWL
jgi:hypothetical protein